MKTLHASSTTMTTFGLTSAVGARVRCTGANAVWSNATAALGSIHAAAPTKTTGPPPLE